MRGYEAQADDYIVKPFDHKELASKVRVHVRQFNAQGAERLNAREALSRLFALINRMSADIGEHTQVITEIQRDLDAIEDPDSDAIVRAMLRLADTNQVTRERLAAAERNLRDQAQCIESHASEARTDALTSLPNRRAFDEELCRRIAEADRADAKLFAIMIDVDDFKRLNDRWGHQAGDKALKAVGRLLAAVAGPMDLVARYGGDEFTSLMPASSLADTVRAVRRIRDTLKRAALDVAGQTVDVTVSIGCAERVPNEDGATLVKRADEAMYAAKKAGKNCAYWHDGTLSHPDGAAETRVALQRSAQQSQHSEALVVQPDTSAFALNSLPSRVLRNYL